MARAPATYEEATYASPWRLISYPHRARVERTVDLALADRPSTVLDYGAGGGEFLFRLLEDPRGTAVELALAYDPNEGRSHRLESRLAGAPQVLVASTLEQVLEALAGRSLDAIVCMGVLEHLPLRERARFFDFCARHLAPRGRVVIDVPVEIGPTLLIKQFGRRVLKRRGREYGPSELLGAVAGRRTVDPDRYGAGSDPDFIYTHKGFDHRVFREELERHQQVIEEVVTPLGRLPSWLGNQEVIYVSRPRGRAAGPEEFSARPGAGG